MNISDTNSAYLVTVSVIRTDNVKRPMCQIGFQSRNDAQEYFNRLVKENSEYFNSNGFKIINTESTEDSVIYTFVSKGHETYPNKRVIEICQILFQYI